MSSLQTQWISKNMCYEGHQLRSHWIYEQTDLMGDAVVAWVGPAQVALDQMVDVEDVKAQAPIASPKMLHFLGEFFQQPLHTGIAWQRLFILLTKESLAAKGVNSLTREGDDLFGSSQGGTKKKLSVSIATVSPVSSLWHVGLNVETEGTPVPTVGLAQWDISPESLAQEVLNLFQQEYQSMQRAAWKVRAVS